MTLMHLYFLHGQPCPICICIVHWHSDQHTYLTHTLPTCVWPRLFPVLVHKLISLLQYTPLSHFQQVRVQAYESLSVNATTYTNSMNYM